MTQVLTREAVLSTLRDIIKEYGEDFKYSTVRPKGHQCVYKWEGAPSCGVGHLVARLAPDVFKKIGTPNDYSVPSNTASSTSLIDYPGSDWGAPLEAEDAELAGQIRRFQGYQDSDYTWGQAFLLAFKEEV